MLSSQKPPESTLRKCKKGKEKKKKRNILQAVESYHPFQGKGLISVDDIRVDRQNLSLALVYVKNNYSIENACNTEEIPRREEL